MSANQQSDLFPDATGEGPVVRLLRDELSPASFSQIKRLGKWLDKLVARQKEKEEIRAAYFKLRRQGTGSTKAMQEICELYNIEHDLLDKIVYPRQTA